MSKPSLIIQGPLISSGVDGAQAHRDIKTLKDSDEITWDCREGTRKTINKYGHLFDQIILSIWKSCPKIMIDNSRTHIIRSPDLNEIKHTVFRLTGQRGINNSHRQFYSFLRGLEKLDDEKLVVKIRTDQQIDLDTLLDYLKRDNCRQHIYFPSSNLNNYVSDYYIAGKVGSLKKIISASLEKFYHPNPHLNIETATCEFLGLNVAEMQNCSDKNFEFPWDEDDKVKNYFFLKFRDGYGLLPRQVFKTINWRGTKISNEYFNSSGELVFGDSYFPFFFIKRIKKILGLKITSSLLARYMRAFHFFRDRF